MAFTKEKADSGRLFISTGTDIENYVGFSRAVREGNWVFVSNTSGYNYDTGKIDDSTAEQASQMLGNVENALTYAGASVEDILRVNIYIVNRDELPEIRPIISQFIKRGKPALSLICTELASPNLKIEMDVTAYINS